MDDQMVVRIAKLASRYHEEYLDKLIPNPEKLRKHWWDACKFFIHKILYQGRSDKVSAIIRTMAEDALVENIDTISPEGLTHTTVKDIQEARIAFEKTEIDGKSYKRQRDIEMLFGIITREGKIKKDGIIHFIRELPGANIVNHSISEIENGWIDQHYKILRSFTGIGHNVAASYLRDVVDLFFDLLRPYVGNVEQQVYLLPVGAWIDRIAREVGIRFRKRSSLSKAKQIAEVCADISLSKRLPISFNQGATWLGANWFEIVMESLGKAPKIARRR
jgi:hypothetical protein